MMKMMKKKIIATVLLVSLSAYAQAQDFNCFTRELWSPEKKAYCCREKNLGCATTTVTRTPILVPSTFLDLETTTTIPNCFSREIWTNEKKDYCCKTKGLGCLPSTNPTTTTTSSKTTISTLTEHNCFSKEVWSDAKRMYCCENMGIGCLGANTPTESTASSVAAALDITAKVSTVSTSLDEYNCFSKELWSDEKRSYCCDKMGLGCILDTTRVQPASEKPQLLPEISTRSSETTDEEAEIESTTTSTNTAIHLTLREAKANTLSLIWATSEHMCQEEVFTITYAPMFAGEILKDQTSVITSLQTFTVLENLLPGVKYHVSVATSNKDSVPTEDIFKTRKRDLKKSNKKKNLKKSANKIVPQRRSAGN